MLSFQQKTDAVFIRATILPFVLKIDHFKLQNLVPPRRLWVRGIICRFGDRCVSNVYQNACWYASRVSSPQIRI